MVKTGIMVHNYKQVKAHRYSYLRFNGEIPENLVVRHKCNVTCCVNPNHLEVGTVKQNSEDMVKAGTSTYGERNPQAKLTEPEVLAIKDLISRGVKYSAIAKLYKVSVGSICNIKTGYSWGYLNIKDEDNGY